MHTDARLLTEFGQPGSDYTTQENDCPLPLFLTQLEFPSVPALSALFLFLLVLIDYCLEVFTFSHPCISPTFGLLPNSNPTSQGRVTLSLVLD